MSLPPVPLQPTEAQAKGSLLCPACRVDLVMADRMGVEIDYCPKCRGVWLDRGELDKIIEMSLRQPSGPVDPGRQDYPDMPPRSPAGGYGGNDWGGHHGGGHGGNDWDGHRGGGGHHGGGYGGHGGHGGRRRSWLGNLFD